jgi:hypothetical protein
MTALFILAAAIACAYLFSFVVTPVLTFVLRRIDRHVRASASQEKIVPPKLLVYEVPSCSMQSPLTSPQIVLAAAVFIIAITVPTPINGVRADMVHYNA